jgi:nucleoside-diphosphate-sugar epimerase
MRILSDTTGATNGKIFNVGNPSNECSVRELAQRLRELYRQKLGPGYRGELSSIEVTEPTITTARVTRTSCTANRPSSERASCSAGSRGSISSNRSS